MYSLLFQRRVCASLILVAASLGLPLAVSAQSADINAPLSLDAAVPQAAARAPVSPASVAAADAQAASLTADHLVRSVLQSNQGIEAMRAAAAAASARIESAGALDDPMVSYALAPNTAGGPRQGLNQDMQISQKLPWPGTLYLRSKAAEAEAKSADLQVADLRLQLTAHARAAYAQWYYVHRALAITAENVAVITRLRAVAKAAYASGVSSQQDVLQAEVELTRLQNQLLELERLRRTVQAKINALQNLDPDTAVPAPADLPDQSALPAFASLRETALARYPMLQSLDARVAASQDRIDLAHKNTYPNISLMAGYNSLWDEPAKRLIVGVSVNIPFGGNHRGEVDEANANLREAEARLADARTQLLSDLAQTYATATQASATIDLYSGHLLTLAKLNLQAAVADYVGGTGDFLKVATAEQQDWTVKLELARARADLFTQLASLDYQTGGALSSRSAATPQDATP